MILSAIMAEQENGNAGLPCRTDEPEKVARMRTLRVWKTI